MAPVQPLDFNVVREPSKAFIAAKHNVDHLGPTSPSNDELLELYALLKIACGFDIKEAPKPGVFDLKGKAKQRKWQELVDENVDAEEAEKRYIALVDKLVNRIGYRDNHKTEAA